MEKAADLGDTLSVGYQFWKLFKDKEPIIPGRAYEWNLKISMFKADEEEDSSNKP